jgi:hypothetical protein
MEEVDAKISSKARSTSSKIKLLSNSRLLGNQLSMASSHTRGIRGVSKINHLTTLRLGFYLGG